MDTLVTIVVAVLLVVGSALNLIAAMGLHRFPDVLCRMHAATKPATLGLLTILAGAAVAVGTPGAAAKLALVGLIQLATNPVGSHMVGRAVWRNGRPVTDRTQVDDAARAGLDD